MEKINMTVWGAAFDELPLGYVGPMTAELVLQELEKREHVYYDEDACLRCTAGDWKTLVLPLPVSSHFMAVATVERATEGLKGHVNIFSLDILSDREQETMEPGRSLASKVNFLIPYGFSWDAEGLFFNSDGPFTPVNDAFAEHLIRDLIVATDAGKVIY